MTAKKKSAETIYAEIAKSMAYNALTRNVKGLFQHGETNLVKVFVRYQYCGGHRENI